jgi:hypothetical protein
VLRDPARSGAVISFTKPMPLPSMVGLMNTLWAEDGAAAPGGAVAASQPPPRGGR